MIQELITLSTIKHHLNVDETFTDDDVIIGLYADTAVDAVSRHLDLAEPLAELYTSDTIPSSIKNVILLLIAELYKNREMSTSNAVNDTKIYGYLVGLYRNLSI